MISFRSLLQLSIPTPTRPVDILELENKPVSRFAGDSFPVMVESLAVDNSRNEVCIDCGKCIADHCSNLSLLSIFLRSVKKEEEGGNQRLSVIETQHSTYFPWTNCPRDTSCSHWQMPRTISLTPFEFPCRLAIVWAATLLHLGTRPRFGADTKRSC